MILGILVHAIWSLVPARARVITHTGRSNGVGVHAVLADDEYSRMNWLGTQNPRALTTNHRDDAVGNGEIHRASTENIDENSRKPPSFVAGCFRIEFDGSTGGRLLIPVMKDLFSVFVDAEWRDAEQVFDADGKAHFFVVLHLAHAHEEIAVLIGVVHLESREDVRCALHSQQGELLGPGLVGIFELDNRRSIADGVDVPSALKQFVFELVAAFAALAAFQNADALGAQCAECGDCRAYDTRMHPVRVARSVSGETAIPRKIDLDADGFSFDMVVDPADLVKHLAELRGQVFIVVVDFGDGHWFCRSRRYTSCVFCGANWSRSRCGIGNRHCTCSETRHCQPIAPRQPFTHGVASFIRSKRLPITKALES